jgi:hypothetical protein
MKKINDIHFPYKYSICALVTNIEEYESMLKSFKQKGFNETNSEFLYIDNTERNIFNAYSGLNHFLTNASGRYVILCHQDIILEHDNEQNLGQCLSELDSMDKSWALAGNAGGVNLSELAIRITDPGGTSKIGTFPSKVVSLDENFIVVNQKNRVCLSGDLEGYHLYGSDLCIIADILGFNNYVINFHLTHNSDSSSVKIPNSYYIDQQKLILKYRRALRGRFIRTTCSRFFVSNSNFLSFLLNKKRILNIVRTLQIK